MTLHEQMKTAGAKISIPLHLTDKALDAYLQKEFKLREKASKQVWKRFQRHQRKILEGE